MCQFTSLLTEHFDFYIMTIQTRVPSAVMLQIDKSTLQKVQPNFFFELQ